MRGNERLLWLSPLPGPDFLAAFRQLGLEPLAEAVMCGGQEKIRMGVSHAFCLLAGVIVCDANQNWRSRLSPVSGDQS